MDLDITGKLEMETIKEEDTPPGSVNTTRENNDSILLPRATGVGNDKESSTSVANHVFTLPLDNDSQSGASSLSDSRSQSESNSLPSAARTPKSLNSSRSQSDCHDASESPSRSRLSRPYLKESGV